MPTKQHSDTTSEELHYGIDYGIPGGDYPSLAIKIGDKLFTFTGYEAEAIVAFGTQQRIDELNEARKWSTKAETAYQVWEQLNDRIEYLSKPTDKEVLDEVMNRNEWQEPLDNLRIKNE